MPDYTQGMPDPNQVMGGMPVAKGPQSQSWSLWDRLQDAVAPWPTELKGLLSNDDVKHARNQGLLGFGSSLLAASGPTTQKVGFGAAVGQAAQQGVGAYKSAIGDQMDRIVARQKLAQGQQGLQSGQMQMDAMKNRQAMMAKFPPPDGSDPAAASAWIDKLVPMLVSSGDTEGASTLMQLRKSMTENHTQQAQTGDLVTTYDPAKGFWDPATKAWVPSLERHMPADQLALKTAQMDAVAARAEAAQGNANNSRVDRLVTNYDRNTKDLFARAVPVNQAMMAINQAKTDPTVGGNAIIAFMTAVDPKAQQRYQMVQWMSSHLTPALAATAERYLQGKATGLLPASLLDAMEAHVKRTRDITIGQATRARREQEKMHPELRGQLRDIATEFDPDDPSGAAAPSAPPAAQNSPEALNQKYKWPSQ